MKYEVLRGFVWRGKEQPPGSILTVPGDIDEATVKAELQIRRLKPVDEEAEAEAAKPKTGGLTTKSLRGGK